MGIAPHPVDPRVRRTRQLLSHAFMELLERQSFDSITVQDIAERATVNRATFYSHFQDKYDLLDKLIRERFQHDLEQRIPGPGRLRARSLYSLATIIFTVLSGVNGHCAPGDRTLQPMFESALQSEVQQTLLDWLQAPQTAAAPASTRDAVATTISWALFGSAAQWSRESQPAPLEQAARQVVDVLLEGIPSALGVALDD